MTAAGSKFRSTSVRFGMEFMRFCCKLWFMFCGEFIMFCGEFMRLWGEFMMLDAEFRMFCWCWGELELFELLPPFCMSLAGGTEGGPPGVIGLWPPLGVCGVCGVCGIWEEVKKSVTFRHWSFSEILPDHSEIFPWRSMDPRNWRSRWDVPRGYWSRCCLRWHWNRHSCPTGLWWDCHTDQTVDFFGCCNCCEKEITILTSNPQKNKTQVITFDPSCFH